MSIYGGIVLAGGMSTRMGAGRDKAAELLGGKVLLQWAIDLLAGFANEIMVAGRDEGEIEGIEQDTRSLPVTFIVDIEKDKGPLGGIYTGLVASSYERNFVIACDMPFLAVDILQMLKDADEGQDAVVLTAGGRMQPLVGIYHKSCLQPMKEQIESGDLAVHRFLAGISTATVKIEDDRALADIDSPEDLEDARRRMERK